MSRSSASRALLLAGFALAFAQDGRAQTTTRVSVGPLGQQASAQQDQRPSISADGRFVAFASAASNLVPDDTNGKSDVFVHDRWTARVERVSVSSSGEQGKQDSFRPWISGDGRLIAFVSNANNLVPGDLNWMDIFVHDRQTGQTTLVSVSSTGVQADQNCHGATISADGSTVAFLSYAANLVPGDTNNKPDVFVRDLAAGTTVRANVSSTGAEADAYTQGMAFLSADGSRIVFESMATNLVPGDTNGTHDAFLRDLAAGTTTRVSVDSSGTQGNGSSWYPAISAGGAFVAFASWADNLVPGDGNGWDDVFVHEVATGITTRVSLLTSGEEPDDSCFVPSISADGRIVAFQSFAANLCGGPYSGWPWMHVYVHDRATAETTLVSQSTAGEVGNDIDLYPVLSADGRHVAFLSSSSNLVPGDSNNDDDVFVRDLAGCTSTVATYCTASTTSIPGCQAAVTTSGTPSLSTPASFVVSSGQVPGGALGLAYYGLFGATEKPFGNQGGYLCALSPRRAPVKASGGTSGACDGQYTLTLQELAAVQPGLYPGQHVSIGFWFRDPPAPDAYGLSDAVWFWLCP